jgi:stage III sporulation protein AB
MFLKLLLCSLIIGLCYLIGHFRAKKISQRVSCLTEMEEILKGLEADMKNEMITLHSALKREAEGRRAFGGMLLYAAGMAKASPGKAFGEVWDTALQKELKENGMLECLTKEDAALLYKTGRSLVHASLSTQEAHFSMLHREYGLAAEKARAEQGKKMKLYNSMGLMAGLFLAILLI